MRMALPHKYGLVRLVAGIGNGRSCSMPAIWYAFRIVQYLRPEELAFNIIIIII